MKRILSFASLPHAAVAAAAIVVLAAAAGPSLASPGDGDPAAGGRAQADGRARGRFERLGHHRRHRAQRLLRALDLTDAQKAELLAAREAASSVREDLRAQVKAIRAEARQGERTAESRKAARERIRAAVASARAAVAPSAARFVASLSPDQKKRLADRAAARGKTFDEARLVKAIERLLIGPGRGGR